MIITDNLHVMRNGFKADAYVFLTAVSGWLYFGLFVSSGLTLAVLITALDRDYHPNFSDAEQTTRTLNQLLTLVVVSFALLESILTPTRVLDGHTPSSSLFHLTHIPKNTRIGLYMLAMATVEPHLFNMFYDSVKAEVHKPINWTFEDLVGSTETEFEGIKIAILDTGPMPKLYEHFIDDDFQWTLMVSRMFLFIGGLIILPLSVVMPHDVSWDSKHWGYGNQRWYEKASLEDPDLKITGFSTFWVGALNIIIGVIKGIVPLFGIMFHYNEFTQHRNDPAHDDAEAKYDFYDPFHFNHTIHSVAMLAFASYLAYDAFRHVLVPLFGSRYKNRVRNYAVIHLFTLIAHVYLVSTMVDANGPTTTDGDDYMTSNWVFVGAHASLYFFQEFAIAPWVMDSNIIMTPIRYAIKWFRVFFFSDFIVDRYMSMLQTVASVSGMLAIVLLVIGINGPWMHAQPIPGTVIAEFSKVLHETAGFVNQTHTRLNHFINHIEASDLFKQLSCTFTDPSDSGSAGSDYMHCDQFNISTWMHGKWHPCDTLWRKNSNSEWKKMDMNKLSLLSQEVSDVLQTGDTDSVKRANIQTLIDDNTASDDKVDEHGHQCKRSGENACMCPNGVSDNCVIPFGLSDDFMDDVVDQLIINTITYGAPAVMHGGHQCEATQTHDPPFETQEEQNAYGDANCPHDDQVEQRIDQDIFAAINNLQSNPYFQKGTGRYDPVHWRDTVEKSGSTRWDNLFGTHSAYDTGFLGLKHLFDGGNPNGHTMTMRNHHLDEGCMRQCNECPINAKNFDTDHNTINRSSGGGCSSGGSCECYGNGHNHGLTTEKRDATDDEKGFCMNMKRCFKNDAEWQVKRKKDKGMWNNLRFNNNHNLTNLKEESQGNPDWDKFDKITHQFYNKGAMTTETANPNKQSTQFAKFVKDVHKSGNWADNLKLHDIFCMDTKNQKLPECQDALAELDNFAGSGFMTELEKTCRTTQCDTFLVMMAVATAMKVAAAAVSLFPFGGGDIGDAILAAEQALEWTIRLVWRFFQFGMRMYRSFRQIMKRIDYYWLLVQGWASFVVFNEFLITVTIKMMTAFLHIFIVGFLSFFIAFWRRQRLEGRARSDAHNLLILLTSAAVLLGACVTVFLVLTPWAINWLLDQILTFHHETQFIKKAFIDIKLVEDVGYVFIVLSSVCATYAAFCWWVLLIKQKENDIRTWVLGKVRWGDEYQFRRSILGTGDTVANSGVGAWVQTAIVMLIVSLIIYNTFDIVEEDNKWIVKGGVFHVNKYTDSAFVDKIAKFFKTNALTANYADVDDSHSTLCDLIGQAIKELFLSILKALMSAVSDVTHQLVNNFAPGLRFVYSAIKRDFDTIMFDAFHITQLLVVFAPPIACVVLFFVGVTGSLLKITQTSQVWIRNLIFIVALNGIAYTVALQSIADTFDEFKIPIFGYKLEFTTAIFKSQICSFLCFMSWVQWRFDEKVPLCRDKTCGEPKTYPESNIPMATAVPASTQSTKLRLRMSSLA